MLELQSNLPSKKWSDSSNMRCNEILLLFYKEFENINFKVERLQTLLDAGHESKLNLRQSN